MLSSAGSLLVTWSAARQPGSTFVLQLSTGPLVAYSYNILQCTSMPNSPLNATRCLGLHYICMHWFLMSQLIVLLFLMRICICCFVAYLANFGLKCLLCVFCIFSSPCAHVCACVLFWSNLEKGTKGDTRGQAARYASLFKSDSTLNKLRGWLLINRYTLMSWIDLKRGQQCRSLTVVFSLVRPALEGVSCIAGGCAGHLEDDEEGRGR